MKVLGIYGSPRQGGNSDRLLDQALAGAGVAGAEVKRLYVRDLKLAGCRECGACDKSGVCRWNDDMQKVYPLLESSEIIILAAPIFFYGLPARMKAMIDRAQAMWNKRRLIKTAEQRKSYDRGRGYLIAVGATKGKDLFKGVQLTAKYFFDALDKSYEGGIFFRELEGRGAVAQKPELLREAYELGMKAAAGGNAKK